MNLFERARQFVQRRAYVYRQTFQTPLGEEVLADLAKFCRAHESTFHSDPRAHALAEGRREVFLRIARHLQLSDEQLWELYPPAVKPTNQE